MKKILFIISISFLLAMSTLAQVPDPDQGLRADWMRGALGALWLPENNYNGNIEGVTMDEFVTQIKDLRTIDYVQVALASPNIFSPVHTAPHPIIESLWEGDTDPGGTPINLVVPRASSGDPFLSWLKAIKAAGLKTEVYLNSYNLLARIPESIPAGYPDLSERWTNYCDTNPEFQNFINNHPYIKAGDPANRKYMFCYAEFILKVYAVRYGSLIDAWCFDSADNIMEACGDHADTGVLDDQRIYQAFADACHAGNPNAAIAFNNSVGVDGAPLATPTLFDDYTFGHPFGGAGNMVVPEILYTRNFAICEFMKEHNGLPFATTDSINWNDNVVGHFFPKQSQTSWNAGNAPCLTDSQFVVWNSTGLINGGAITWGTPLVRTNMANSPVLTLQPYALEQLTLTDNHLKEFQYPGAPNWARQATILSDAIIGTAYSDTLVEGKDFWDPEGDDITEVIFVAEDSVPSWLSINETQSGIWVLSGTCDETVAKSYNFRIRAKDASGERDRMVNLKVSDPNATIPANGLTVYPNWYTLKMYLATTYKLTAQLAPVNASNQSITWTSSDTTIASVNETGLVTAIDSGEVVITATTLDGAFTDSCKIVVIKEKEIVECLSANIALCGVATQSSTFKNSGAWLAIDGNTDGGYSKGSVSHTLEENNPWWAVDLGKEHSIGDIVVFNRTDGVVSSARLDKFTVKVFDKDSIEVFTQTYDTIPDPSATINAGGVIGQIVVIQLNDSTILHMSEVQVFEYTTETYSVDITSENGSVLITPNQESYSPGTEVKITALPNIGYAFESWGGDIGEATIDGKTLTILMYGNKSITATFVPSEDSEGKTDGLLYALENTDYGLNAVATLISDVQLASDNQATFRITCNVTPPAGSSIKSGNGGGAAASDIDWGIFTPSETNVNNEKLFNGDINEWAVLDSIQIIDFNANGGDLTLDDFTDISFSTVNIINAQSPNKDAVAFKVNDVLTEIDNTSSSVDTIDVMEKTGVSLIENFSIGTGSSTNQTANKWAVRYIGVNYTLSRPVGNHVLKLKNDYNFSISPNPSKGKFRVNMEQATNATFVVYSINGAKLKEGFANGSFELDLNDFKRGLYLFELNSDMGRGVKKIVLH